MKETASSHKKSENKIKDENIDSNITFQSFFNMIPLGVVYQDAGGEIIMANTAAEKILGLTVSQMKGRTSHDPRWRAIHEDGSDFSGDDHPSMLALKTGRKVSNTIMGIFNPEKKDITWINIHGHPLFRQGEKTPYMVFTTFEDITDRKKAEEALFKNEEKYRYSIESAPYGIAVHDPQGKILIYNSQIEKISGYSGKDIPDIQTWFKLLYPDEKYRKYILNERNKIKPGASKQIIEAEITRKDGEKCTCQFIASVSPSGIRNIFINDITEQKYIYEALKESEERFRTLVDKASGAIVVHDIDGNIMIANSLTSKYLGYSKEELLSMNVANLDDDIIIHEHRKKYWDSLAFGENIKFNTLHTRKDKSTYPAEVHLVKIMFKEQPIILAFIHDITELKQHETELHKAKEKAEESDRLKSAFLANMSHEIRTPLNGMLGFADMLKNPGLSEVKRKHFIDIIMEGGQHLLQIVNDIIDISKIEAQQIEINESVTCINDLLIELFAFYEPIARKNAINLYYQKNLVDAQSKVYTDGVKLKQIIQNLLSNAEKFTHKGYIKFGYILKDNYLEFFIEDTGIGIAPKLHKHIFERFRQGDSNLYREYGGTGLGLSIAKAYVQIMGGKIWLTSKPGRGTKFFFTIPYKPAKDKKKPKGSNKLKSYVELESIKVLIVEDDDVNLLYLKEVLATIKADVFHAENGNEAIEICSNHPEINIVLMDIKLPDMNGYDVTKTIKQCNPDMPVIAQTAYALEGDRDKALECGCDEYIAKPIKRDELIELIFKYRKK